MLSTKILLKQRNCNSSHAVGPFPRPGFKGYFCCTSSFHRDVLHGISVDNAPDMKWVNSARYPFPRCCFRMAQSCLAVKSEMSNREFDPSDESPAAGGSGFRENPSSDLLQLISKVVQGAIVEDWIA